MPLDWRRLVVTDPTGVRAAIFAESFPAELDKAGPAVVALFDETEALEVLETFAGAWPTLSPDEINPVRRWIIKGYENSSVVVRFSGVELRLDLEGEPKPIIVDHVSPIVSR